MTNLGARGAVACIVATTIALFSGINQSAHASNASLQLPWPTGGTHNPGISRYGCSYGCGGHTGVDYYAVDWNLSNDSQVSAVLAGTAHITTNSCGGNIVWIDHGGGLISYYAHLDGLHISVTENQAVVQGQLLALSDDSGTCSTGAHLHFAMHSGATNWQNGSPYAPEPMTGPSGTVYTGFGSYGASTGVDSPAYTSTPGGPPPVEQVTVAQRPERITEDLLIRSPTASGPTSGVHQPTDPGGTPFTSDDLGGVLKGSPTGVWNATTTRFDVFGVGTSDRVFHKAWVSGSPSYWTPWTQIDSSGSLGISFSSQSEIVNVDRRPNTGFIDIFIRGSSSDAQHAILDQNGANPAWESLGGYVKGAPSGRWNPNGFLLDVYAISSDDHPYHKVLNLYSGWGSWQGPMTLATVASAETELITLVRRTDGNMDLVAQGTNNHAFHYPVDASGDIFAADDLGGVILGAPDGKWNANTTRLDVFAIGTTNQIFQITWTSPTWGSWRLVPGGVLWG